MELKNVKLNHLKNLTIVNCNGTDLSVAVVNRGVEFSECNNIYVWFNADKVEKCIRDEDLAVKSFAVLECAEDYPDDMKIGDIGKVKPTIRSYFSTYLDFCGVVTDVQKIPDGSIDKYTKNPQMGYFITINTSEWSFVLNYCSASDVADVFSRITGMKKSDCYDCYIPKIGEQIKGIAQVIGVLFR